MTSNLGFCTMEREDFSDETAHLLELALLLVLLALCILLKLRSAWKRGLNYETSI